MPKTWGAIRAKYAPSSASLSINILLVDTGEKRVLIDTGVGRDAGRGEGKIGELLTSIGVKPETINSIILTHGHWDHIGGITNTDGGLVFPNARYFMPQTEWNLWTSEEYLKSVPDILARWAGDNLPPIDGQVTLIGNRGDIMPGFEAIPAEGHTPGQISVLIRSDDECLLHLADAAHHILQIEFPHVNPTVEVLPDVSLRTRDQLPKRAASDGCLVTGYHVAFPGLGTIEVISRGQEWRPYGTS